ncbi:hypothetical protein, partial [Streptomyces tailanensis]|uniref:hypothetical protein n=1 Tax=Streptomyces tailanensis TaxID=2569858 RepID=UPI001C0EB2FD
MAALSVELVELGKVGQVVEECSFGHALAAEIGPDRPLFVGERERPQGDFKVAVVAESCRSRWCDACWP